MPRLTRNQAAARLAAQELVALPPGGPVLVVGDPLDDVAASTREVGVAVERWDRRAVSGRSAQAWPPPGPFALAAVRLPKARDELDMAVHAALSVLESGGRLLVYGANDEGIRSVPGRLEPLVGTVGTLAVGGHARLLGAVRPERVPGLRGALADWRVREPVALPWGTVRWTSYAGVFAHGRLDSGTALLLANLPAVESGQRVLDYGAGSGFLAAGVLRASPAAEMTLLEVDAVAAEAARENVPGARVVVGDGWPALDPAERFHAVVANPPYHQGKRETLAEIDALADGLVHRLEPGGVARVVVQRRHPVGELLEARLGDAWPVADQGPYRVWEARKV